MNSRFVDPRRQGEGLWSWNLASNRFHFSPEWLRLVGCEEHEVGNTQDAWLRRVHPGDIAQVSRAIDAFLTDGSEAFEIRHRLLHKDGSHRWTSCRGVVQRDASGQAVRIDASHADITAEMVSDPSTGLPNRLLLIEHVTRSIERASRYPGFHFALLCIDLGGPDAGDGTSARTLDAILPAVARRLETSLRTREVPPTLRHNDVAARLHDDVFAILLDGLKELEHATVAAERILAEILTPFMVNGRELHLSPSIGIAVSATGYLLADDVLRDAETALHRAKLLGRSRCEVFDTAVLRSAKAELRLESDFEGALDRGEFQLSYQPIVSLTTNVMVGFEAVVRWQHPVLGLISPQEFIPLAEKTGFIVRLGRSVLREACAQLKAWQDAFVDAKWLWVSVNLSMVQFKHPRLLEEVAEVLRDSGLDPRCLVLELTEGVALANPAAVRSVLMQLRALGVRISVDDFGTGYSSLAYLRQLPLDSLKVDRAFVRGIEANEDMVGIFSAVSNMARQLGLQVVAEGIEKEEQLALVRALDCGFGQGYLFSRPLDSAEMAGVLQAGLSPHPAAPELVTATAEKGEGWRPSSRIRWVYAMTAGLAVIALAGVPRFFAEPPAAPSRSADIALVTPAPVTPAVPAATNGGAAPSTMSMRALHQHRLGSCRGLLVVSGERLRFVPDQHDGEAGHGFSLRQGQFLHNLSGDSLTIRSNDRDYRFKAVAATGKGDDQLARLVNRLTAPR